jgi:Protein of unknown function (DUF1326)
VIRIGFEADKGTLIRFVDRYPRSWLAQTCKHPQPKGFTYYPCQQRWTIAYHACHSNKKERRIDIMTTTPQTSQLKGSVFAAQACSCSCNPCTCGDHCTCQGVEAYIGPRWRFVGDHIEAGMASGEDMSQRILLNLAQNAEEQAQDWHEVILIDDCATPDQVQALLQVFGGSQGSEISHPHRLPSDRRPAYLVPMRYTIIDGHPTLSATFSQHRSRLVQANASVPFFKEWTYNGPVVVQQPLEQWN